ncbi:hypothetical protein [Streptomyces erythrochromogenes]|uniref:hypothetical protein n=1 Tax=Streptomyces erythrochromogenes TaxID=285574 RepID=UPI00381B684B
MNSSSMAAGWTWRRPGDHFRGMHPSADVAEALRLVPDVVYPPADCGDVAEWVAQYNARNLGLRAPDQQFMSP